MEKKPDIGFETHLGRYVFKEVGMYLRRRFAHGLRNVAGTAVQSNQSFDDLIADPSNDLIPVSVLETGPTADNQSGASQKTVALDEQAIRSIPCSGYGCNNARRPPADNHNVGFHIFVITYVFIGTAGTHSSSPPRVGELRSKRSLQRFLSLQGVTHLNDHAKLGFTRNALSRSFEQFTIRWNQH
jgi:hypothetical protein